MAEVKVKVTTEADLKGIQSTEQALSRLEQTTGKSAAESAKFFKETAAGRQTAEDTAGALSQMTREAKAFSGEVETKAEPSLKRLATGFKDLGREIPLVGVAIRALANPWTFLGAAIAGVVVWFQKQIDVQRELIKSGAELSARLDPLIVRQERTKQLMAESQIAADNFNRKLREQADALGAVRDRQREANEELDNRNELQAAQEDADRQLALAQAGDDPAARAAVDDQFRARARQRQGLVNMGRIGAAHRALREAEALGREAQAALPGARAQLQEAEQGVGGQLDDVNAALGQKETEGARLQKELGEAETFARGPFAMPGIGATAQEKVAEARAALKAHNQGVDALRARKRTLEAGVAPFRERVAGLERDITSSRNAVPGLQGEFNRAVGQEENQRKIFSSTAPAIAEAQRLAVETAQLRDVLKESARLQREAAREQSEANREFRAIIKANHGR